MDEQQQRIAALEDLVSTLWLYTGRQAWMSLTTEQKELFADVVDASHQAQDAAEGRAPGDRGSFTPILRWWREDGDESRAIRVTLPAIASSHSQGVSLAAGTEGHEVVVLGCTAARMVTGEFASALIQRLESNGVLRVRLHNASSHIASVFVDAASGRRITVETAERKAS